MIELSVILAGIVANALTAWTKPDEREKKYLSETELAARKTFIRAANALLGIISLAGAAYLLGEPLEVTSITGLLETLFAAALTFGSSQGWYFLTKRKKVDSSSTQPV